MDLLERIDQAICKVEEQLALYYSLRDAYTENDDLRKDRERWKTLALALQDVLDGNVRPISDLIKQAGGISGSDEML